MRLYKHHITPFLQVLLVLCALATLASCVSDKFWEQLEASRNPEPETTPYYMSLTVLNPSGSSVGNTRAVGDADYEDGTGLEHQVGEEGNYVILLNGDKTLYGVYPLKLYKWQDYEYEGDDTKEAAYIYITHFYHDEKKALPQYGLVVMNADKSISDWLEGLPKSDENSEADILKKVWEEKSNPKKIGFGEGDGDNPKYFTLTNSAYVNDGSAQVAVKIPKDRIYKSLDLAKKNPVTVYVERMVARFDFGFEEPTAANEETKTEHTYKPVTTLAISMFDGYDPSQKSHDDDPTYPGEIITTDIVEKSQIKVTGWGINALETQSYPFKSIAANGAADWNDEALHRYLWGMDPHYTQNNTDKYPWQFREAIQKGDLDYYEQGASPLKNYSYNDFVNKGIERTVYTPENTYNADILNSLYLDGRNNVLAGTHLIVCAELKTNFYGLNKEIYPNSNDELESHDLYRDITGVYYPTAKLCLAELVRRFNRDLTSNPVMRYHYYYWNAEDDNELKQNNFNNGEEFIARPSGDYQLYLKDDKEGWKPFTYASVMNLDDDKVVLPSATILNGDGQVLPWVASLIDKLDIRKGPKDTDRLPIYKKDYDYVEDEAEIKKGNAPKPKRPGINDATRNDIKSLLLEWLGAVDHFQGGKMYYAEAIEHRLGYDDKYQAYQTGSYGVVRNTWHQITLTDIKYLGTPIDNPDQPIVPNGVVLKDQVNFTIKMLPWHGVSTTVTLPK